MTFELFGLFFNGFLSATLLPGTSEVLFLYLLSNDLSPWLGLMFVSTGNIGGAVLSFYMGFGARTLVSKKSATPVKHYVWLDRFGPVVLFWSWVPIIGDPLVVAAGAMKMPVLPALVWISVGKIFRYLLIASPFLMA